MPKTTEKIKAKSIDEAIEKGTLKDIGKLPEGFEVNTTARDEVTVLKNTVKKVKSLPGKIMARTSSVNRTLSGFHPIRKRLSMITIKDTEFSGQALTYNNVRYFEPGDSAGYTATYTTERVKAKGSYTQSIGGKEKSGDLTLSKGETKTVTCKKKIKKAQTVNCSAKAAGKAGFLKDSISEPFNVGLLSYKLAGLDEYPIEDYGNFDKPKYLKEYSSVEGMWSKIESTAQKVQKNGFFGVYPEGKITILDGIKYGNTCYRVPDDTIKIKYEVRFKVKDTTATFKEDATQPFILMMNYNDNKHYTALVGKMNLPSGKLGPDETSDWYSKTINIPEPFHGELFAQVGMLFFLCETKRFKLGSLVPPGGESQAGSQEELQGTSGSEEEEEEEKEEESTSETRRRRRRPSRKRRGL